MVSDKLIDDRELFSKPPTSLARDTVMANSKLRNDLLQLRTSFADRRLARSITRAVIQDGDIVAAHRQLEEEARTDREYAQTLSSGNRRAHLTLPAPPVLEPDNETLSRLAGLYISGDTGRALMPNNLRETETAGIEEQTALVVRNHECVICGDTKSYFEVLRVPCGKVLWKP